MRSVASKTPVAKLEPDRRALLNGGAVESATLTECLAVDFAALMRAALPELPVGALSRLEQAASEGISRRMVLAGRLIHDHGGLAGIEELRGHRSDTVRGWACFAIGTAPGLTLPERLAMIRPFADDHHFGVREWSWMAVRPEIAADLDTAISCLSDWTSEPSERLRRFASEATRPRGVWCAHIRALRECPARALPLLEPLKIDPAFCVQDSVGNWLNDAGKDHPDWVRGLCDRWAGESPSPATARIRRRAMRSIEREK